MITTDIVTIAYGGMEDVEKCKASIEEHCTDYNLIVIDNNEVNRGFTVGMNLGILQGEAPYVWLLNQDAVVLGGAQEALIRRLEHDEKIGIAGSMQLDPDDNDLIRHGGTIRAFPGGQHKGGKLSMGHCSLPEKQTWVNFASVMLKREMIRHIGVLDENMFLLYSDSDYCYWARYRGWEVWYEPESRVIHRLGKGSKQISEWHQKDMAKFMDKWGIIPLEGGRFESSRVFGRLDTHP
jgi:GT2 family glycosyltransferase